jgi:hypothetical protein
MAQCDRGHVAITFEGEFSSLCPMCNLVNERVAAAEKEKLAALSELEAKEATEAELDEVRIEFRAYRRLHPEEPK